MKSMMTSKADKAVWCLGAKTLALAGSCVVLLLGGSVVHAQAWTTVPKVANVFGYEAGLDGVPGSAGDDDNNGTIDDIGEFGWQGSDDVWKLTSSPEQVGTFNRVPRFPGEQASVMTANWSMVSTATDVGGGNWLYVWTLTNLGTADLVKWFGPPGGPGFITVLNNLGTPELDGSADGARDLTTAESFEVISRVAGGPPMRAPYRLGFNPETDSSGAYLMPVPEPSEAALLCCGLAALLLARRKKADG